MHRRSVSFTLTTCFLIGGSLFAQDSPRWTKPIEEALAKAGENRKELETALNKAPKEQQAGIAFLIANMPISDLKSLKADFLLSNTDLAYKARKEVPWGKDIPEALFLNDVLPYANVDEKRDGWRKEFYDLCMPIAKSCKTPAEAAQAINNVIFKKINVQYSTQRKAPNQSPSESISQGKASCTGLSIVLSDACRAVCIPARLVGTAMWANKRGNHTWVEVWDKDWHFTGACEPDPKGLDHGWFIGDAAQAVKDSPEHAIFATSFQKSDAHFPLVWARKNKSVPGENVTDRYAKKSDAKPTSAKVMVRVVDQSGKRVATPIAVSIGGKNSKLELELTSRGETADANDFATFEIDPVKEITIRVGTIEKKISTPAAGGQQLVEFKLGETSPAHIEETKNSHSKPLTKSEADAARELLWKSHVEKIRVERVAEMKDKVIKDGKLEMPFAFKTFGKKPEGGRSLWISMHGGGGAPKKVNDGQWENQKKLYTVEEGIYLAPRAPTNNWNLWHEAHIDRMFTRLIEDLIVFEDVNPEKVYVMGYSAGGDGVYQIGPRMADSWAGAAMMAGHPNGVSMLSVRNLPFALQVGGEDAAYNRNKVAKEYGEKLDALKMEDPAGYEHFVKIHEGKGHWMKLEDKAALPWMAKFTRNSTPDRVVWKQTGTPHDRFYWLAVPKDQANNDSLVIAQRKGQTIDIVAAEKIKTLLIRLDDRMMDLDKPVVVTYSGKTLYSGTPPRTIDVLAKTLDGRGDPKLMFDAEIAVEIPSSH